MVVCFVVEEGAEEPHSRWEKEKTKVIRLRRVLEMLIVKLRNKRGNTLWNQVTRIVTEAAVWRFKGVQVQVWCYQVYSELIVYR